LIRLKVLALVVNDTLDFNSLKELLQLTGGTLASHLKGLEMEGLVIVEKTLIGRKPNRHYRLSSLRCATFFVQFVTLEIFNNDFK